MSSLPLLSEAEAGLVAVLARLSSVVSTSSPLSDGKPAVVLVVASTSTSVMTEEALVILLARPSAVVLTSLRCCRRECWWCADVTADGGRPGGGGGVDVDVTAVGCTAGCGGGGGVDADVTAVGGTAGGDGSGGTAGGGTGGGVDADVTAVGGRAVGGAGGGDDADVTAVGGRAGGGVYADDVSAVRGRADGGPGAVARSDVDVVVSGTAIVVEVVGCAPIYQCHGSTGYSRRGSVARVDAFRAFCCWQRRRRDGGLRTSTDAAAAWRRLNSSCTQLRHLRPPLPFVQYRCMTGCRKCPLRSGIVAPLSRKAEIRSS